MGRRRGRRALPGRCWSMAVYGYRRMIESFSPARGQAGGRRACGAGLARPRRTGPGAFLGMGEESVMICVMDVAAVAIGVLLLVAVLVDVAAGRRESLAARFAEWRARK